MRKATHRRGSILAATAVLAAGMGGTALANSFSESPLGALTHTISELYKGKSVEITAQPVEVPSVITSKGPVAWAKAQPIVVTAENGHDYYAYSRFIGHEPSFNTTVEGTLTKMFFNELTEQQQKHLHLTTAHLDAARVLVESQTDQPVGYIR